MKKSYQVLFLILALSVWSGYLFSYCQWLPENEINYFDLFSEIFLLAFVLFLLWVNIKLTNKNTKTHRLFYGLCLLLVGHVHDLIDELISISPAVFALILENIATDIGILLVALGLYHWSKDYKNQVNLLQKQKLALTSASNTDAMTGLYNRRFLNNEFKTELAATNLNTTPYTLLMLDLDNFKKFNDTFGHMQGDQLIKYAADVIKNSVRQGDYAFRYGGEEFLLVIQGNLDISRRIAERIHLAYRNQHYQVINNETAAISVSIGIMPLFADIAFDISLNKADQALYQAKKSGKDCIVEAVNNSLFEQENTNVDELKVNIEKLQAS